MNAAIATWLGELDAIDAAAKALTDSASEAQFSWRPGAGRWSVGECFDHLAITTGLVAQSLQAVLDQGKLAGRVGHPPFRYGLVGGWFVRAMEKPGKRPMPSPENFMPSFGGAKTAVLGRFFGAQHELREALESAHGLALDKIKAPSTAKGAGWLKLNTAAWFASTLAHQRRHLGQARRVTEAAGYPTA